MNKNTNAHGIVEYGSLIECMHEDDGFHMGQRKIFYISDIHLEHKADKGFAEMPYEEYINHVVRRMIGDDPFGNDPLIIVGDVASSFAHFDFFLKQLRSSRDSKPIILVLGNHDLWAFDSDSRECDNIIMEYRNICRKHDVIMLQNDIIFFYDCRTMNGEILQYYKHVLLSEDEILALSNAELQQYASKSQLIIWGSIGFSGKNKTVTSDGRLYNADYGLYHNVVSSLEEDIKRSQQCENVYLKICEALNTKEVVIATHCPMSDWTTSEHISRFRYVSGHTHRNMFENNDLRHIFADNQIGYKKDNYLLKYFLIDGTYDLFSEYEDGIHLITYEQYLEFNLGKNITLKLQDREKKIHMIKRSDYYMFVYYNKQSQLRMLNGGTGTILPLYHDIHYYYDNLITYGDNLKAIMQKYIALQCEVSQCIQKIGGTGAIHGCIVDIDYFNHVYVNPVDGKCTPYYAIDMEQKYVYQSLEALLSDKKPLLLKNYEQWKIENPNINLMVVSDANSVHEAVFYSSKSIYKPSRIIKRIQYFVFQNVVRNWNDTILKNNIGLNDLENVLVNSEY